MEPRSACASSAGGHAAERCELDDIMFHKIADLASPILMQTCATGKTIPKAKFEFMRADGDGKPIKYFEIELEVEDSNKFIPMKGDVVVLQPYEGGNPSGHIAAFDGRIWISDFRQIDFWSGPGYRRKRPAHVFYRP